MALLIRRLVVLLLDVKLAEKVERNDRVDVHDDDEQHDGEQELRVKTKKVINMSPIFLSTP